MPGLRKITVRAQGWKRKIPSPFIAAFINDRSVIQAAYHRFWVSSWLWQGFNFASPVVCRKPPIILA
jgi:hypothetical protein